MLIACKWGDERMFKCHSPLFSAQKPHMCYVFATCKAAPCPPPMAGLGPRGAILSLIACNESTLTRLFGMNQYVRMGCFNWWPTSYKRPISSPNLTNIMSNHLAESIGTFENSQQLDSARQVLFISWRMEFKFTNKIIKKSLDGKSCFTGKLTNLVLNTY